MAHHVPTATLERVVKERARELRRERVGYIAAVNIVVDELYRASYGRRSRISDLGAGVTAPQILALLRLLGSAITWLARVVTSGLQKVEGGRTALREMVSPWVSEVYEADSPAQ